MLNWGNIPKVKICVGINKCRKIAENPLKYKESIWGNINSEYQFSTKNWVKNSFWTKIILVTNTYKYIQILVGTITKPLEGNDVCTNYYKLYK